ncbi:MAG: hypothetical protein H0W86_01015 [Armatimonadetes bacterium]|nr:hypothetical protein [Armatimonadota bacterium]
MKYATSAFAFFLAICANAQWTVVYLHPDGMDVSVARGVSGGEQGGYVAEDNGRYHPSLWNGTASSWTDLTPPGFFDGRVYGVRSGRQVGFSFENQTGTVRRHAILWSGAAESAVSLMPGGMESSWGWGISEDQQVGITGQGTTARAALWSGTAESYVNLHPAGAENSQSNGVSGGQQVGYAGFADGLHASLWNGTAASWVDLKPAGSGQSHALAVDAGQQVGYADVDGVRRASVWTGTAGSWIDLNPTGVTESQASGVHAGQQVGYAHMVDGRDHAGMWFGTAGSWVDLHTFLLPGFTSSEARDISHEGAFTSVVGFGRFDGQPSLQAVMWVSRASAPTSYSIFRGSVISGTLASLLSSDDDKLVMRPGAVFSNAEPPIQIILNSTAPTSSPAGFSFSLESNASIANAEQKISLYNYVAGQYEVLDTRLATTADDTVHVSVTTNTSRFIQPLTMAIRARVSYRALGATFVYPWLGRIDKAWWAFPG